MDTSLAFDDPESRTPPFVPVSTADLLAAAGPPLAWVVPGYLGEGLTVLAGRQKLGKSWLAMDFAVAVATGGKAMGSVACEQGDVLYVDFENGPRRIAARIAALAAASSTPEPARLSWELSAPPPTDEAFLASLERWRSVAARPRLVVVDGPPRIRPGGRTSQRIWGNDHAALALLQRWAGAHGLAVLCVCRILKAHADDPLEADEATAALAFADTTLLLDRDRDGLTLAVRGRDVEEVRPALRFTAGAWSLLGDAVTVNRSRNRRLIVDLIDDLGKLGPSEIAEQTGLSYDNVRQLLSRMVRDGELYRDGWGNYELINDESYHWKRQQSRAARDKLASQLSQSSRKSRKTSRNKDLEMNEL